SRHGGFLHSDLGRYHGGLRRLRGRRTRLPQRYPGQSRRYRRRLRQRVARPDHQGRPGRYRRAAHPGRRRVGEDVGATHERPQRLPTHRRRQRTRVVRRHAQRRPGGLTMANLVGGDINSLYSLADNLQPCAGKVDTVVDSLNTSVKKISDGAGWSGDAATVFEEHWEVGSVAAALVGAFCKATWQAVHDLADNLSTVEADLRAAADEARRNGVAVGPDGTPPEVYGPVNPSSPAATYTYLWQQYRSTAEGFRLQAERTLLEIAHQIEGVADGP